jgi:formate hydrogenlyase transcriptional activator
VFPITVPALRERREDIPRLVQHFAAHAARKLGRSLEGVSPAFLERACAYDWPGNIRELENLVERAMIMSPGALLDGADLLSVAPAASAPGVTLSHATLEEIERAHIHRVLDGTRWLIEGERGAARILGLNPSTLRGRLRKLGIRKSS